MIVAPGMGSAATVVLKSDEKLPGHLNIVGVLVFREQASGPRTWTVIKGPTDILSPELVSTPLDKELEDVLDSENS